MTRRIPIQARSREKVAHLIRVANRLIERDGYRAFTTNRLAKEAKVGVASIYEYFENKDQILLAVVERELANTMAKVEARVSEALRLPPVEGMRSLLTLLLTEVMQKSELVQAIAGHLHGASRFPAAVKTFGQGELLLRLLLSTYSGRRDTDVALDAFLVTNSIAGVCIGVADGLPPGKSLDDVVERLVRHFVSFLELRSDA